MALAPSKIFAGYRALGFVSNHVPLVTRYHKRHKDNYVITCVGQAFHVYNINKLGIVAVSDVHPKDINVLAVDFLYVFTAAANDIYGVVRNKKIEKKYIGHNAEVTLLLPFGRHLISVDANGVMIVWDIKSQAIRFVKSSIIPEQCWICEWGSPQFGQAYFDKQQYLQSKFDPSAFDVTAIAHPHTYVNKVLLGSRQGTLQLWNIRTNLLIYSFSGWDSAVVTMQQSTAIDVMAIGLSDGHVILHNLAVDKTIVKFKQDYGPVTSIGFRTDGHPMMVTGSSAGHIALWDLENRKLHSYMKEAHYSSVTGLTCLPSEPLMVTSAADNSLKVWIFDLPDGGARLLRLRDGHSAPPTHIRFYGNDGQNILSAGQDSTMRSFSTIHDKYNKSLGRASSHKKASKKAGLKQDKYRMPPVVQFAAEPNRDSDWDSIIACHRALGQVTSWSYHRSTMGKHTFLHPRFKQDVSEHAITASAVDVSSCGNFAVIGYSSGHVDMYNLQSGLHRGTFGSPRAHDCTVRGVAFDPLNQKLITGGGDGCVRFWRLKAKTLLDEVKMEAPISQLLLHRESSMMAVALDNFSINIVDIDFRRVVRHFSGHSSAITDMTFKADGRWLVSASMDCSIRTWSLPTGHLIDVFMVESAVTSLTFSACGNFLATAHVGDVGVYLWSNRTLYSHVSLGPLPAGYTPKLADLPGTDSTNAGSDGTADIEDENEEYKSPEQIDKELVTLSLLSTSRWLNLINLDVIKMRNKPKEPPKVPQSAPFFLPTVAGLVPEFDLPKGTTDQNAASRVKKPELGALSDLAIMLTKAHQTGQYVDVLGKMKEMGPSAIDKEIRLLSADDGGSDDVMVYFLEFIESTLATNKDFEVAHAYLGLFMKVHGEDISSKPELTEALARVEKCRLESWDRVQTLLQKTLGLVTYLRSATL